MPCSDACKQQPNQRTHLLPRLMNDNQDNHPVNKLTWLQQIRAYFTIGTHSGKIPELDGIRAIAIIMVMLHHFSFIYREVSNSFYRQAIITPLKNFMNNGWLGVDLFFVLSGFLIVRHLLRKQSDNLKTDHKNFFLKRILRTFPLYYAIIILLVSGVLPSYMGQISLNELLIHVFFLQDYMGSEILTPLWSLATEEKFYLLSPLLVWWITKLKPTQGIVLLLALMTLLIMIRTLHIHLSSDSHSYFQFFWLYRAPFQYAVTGILAGVLVAWLNEKTNGKPGVVLVSLSVVIAMVLLTRIDSTTTESAMALHLMHTGLIAAFALWVWAAVSYSGSRWMGWLTGRFLRIIAILSYAMYLVHNTVFKWVYQLHKDWVYSETAWVHATTFFAIYLLLTAGISLALHYLIEKPFLLLKQRY